MGTRNAWLVLGILVGLSAWGLTIWITHVNHGEKPVVTVVFDEEPPFVLNADALDFGALARDRHRIPEAVLTSPARVLFLVTAATRSIRLLGIHPDSISCGLFPGLVGSAAFWVSDAPDAALPPVQTVATGSDTLIPVPPSLARLLALTSGVKGGIACRFHRRVAMAPTFTERAVTIRAETKSSGAVLVNVSALEDIDDLRFSGGLQLPFGGDRSRLLYGENNVVSAEWTDVTAQEQRDIILVLIGALSAIAAATIIEALRPLVEGRKEA